MSTSQARQTPRKQSAIKKSSSVQSKGGTSSHVATAMLHVATPFCPRRRRTISNQSGGSKAGWKAGNLSTHRRQWNMTMRVRIVCIACTALKGTSRSATSNLATRRGTHFVGITNMPRSGSGGLATRVSNLAISCKDQFFKCAFLSVFFSRSR